jgi:hypothetical protein
MLKEMIVDNDDVVHPKHKIDKSNLILTYKGEECDYNQPIAFYSNEGTFTVDYKDHIVLEFTTLSDSEEPVLKYKFIAYADMKEHATKNKKPFPFPALKYIE